MEFRAIFAHGGMICQGAGHTTKHTNVITGDIVEEICRRFITDCRFENFLLVAYRKPLVPLETS